VEDIMHTLAARMGFALRHNVIEAHGLCAGCVEVEACSTPGHCQHDHTIQLKRKPAEALAAAGIKGVVHITQRVKTRRFRYQR
jgi:hypothetical protein